MDEQPSHAADWEADERDRAWRKQNAAKMEQCAARLRALTFTQAGMDLLEWFIRANWGKDTWHDIEWWLLEGCPEPE